MLTFLPGNAQHIGSRSEQQDAFSFSDPSDSRFLQHGGLLAVVADGMGGMQGGRAASTAAIQAFTRAYAAKTADEAIPHALQRSLHEANIAVLSASPGSGSTLVAAVTLDDTLFWIAVGDSRAYLLRGGTLTQLNADHLLLEDLLTQVANRQMDRADALANPRGQHLTSYLGLNDLPHVDVAVRGLPLQAGDTVLLCSDGVYKVLSEGELAGACSDRTPVAACEAVRDAVIARSVQRQDNLTILAMRCECATSAAVALPANRLSAPVRALLAGFLAFIALGGYAAWQQFHYAPPPTSQKHTAPASTRPLPGATNLKSPAGTQAAPRERLQQGPLSPQGPGMTGSNGNAPMPPPTPAAPIITTPDPAVPGTPELHQDRSTPQAEQ